MAFRNAEFSENSLYRKFKKKRHAKRNGKNGFVFLLLLSLQFKYFIISATTYFFMSFVIKIIIKPLASVGFSSPVLLLLVPLPVVWRRGVDSSSAHMMGDPINGERI